MWKDLSIEVSSRFFLHLFSSFFSSQGFHYSFELNRSAVWLAFSVSTSWLIRTFGYNLLRILRLINFCFLSIRYIYWDMIVIMMMISTILEI